MLSHQRIYRSFVVDAFDVKPVYLIFRGLSFFRRAHASIGHVRKYTNQSYFIEHLVPVAHTVLKWTHDAEMIVAALGHDYIEDVVRHKHSQFSIALLEREFGARITQLILELTDAYTKTKFPQLNRKFRRMMEDIRLSTVSDDAKLIKLADLIHNTKDIVKQDPHFAVVYLREKRALLPLLFVPKYWYAWMFAYWVYVKAKFDLLCKLGWSLSSY